MGCRLVFAANLNPTYQILHSETVLVEKLATKYNCRAAAGNFVETLNTIVSLNSDKAAYLSVKCAKDKIKLQEVFNASKMDFTTNYAAVTTNAMAVKASTEVDANATFSRVELEVHRNTLEKNKVYQQFKRILDVTVDVKTAKAALRTAAETQAAALRKQFAEKKEKTINGANGLSAARKFAEETASNTFAEAIVRLESEANESTEKCQVSLATLKRNIASDVNTLAEM